MALSDRWTLNQIRSSLRRELLDPTGKFWSNDELDKYIEDWQSILQTQYEFVWSTATITFTSTQTAFTIGSFASDAMRLDAVYYCAGGTSTATGRLSPRTMADLDTLQRNWRGTAAASGIDPVIVYPIDSGTIGFWPPPNGTGSAYFEYPKELTFATSTSTMQIPPWTRYSSIPYCLYRCYSRFAATQDLTKALRYRKAWERQLKYIRRFYDAYFPDKSEMLRPGRKWAGQVLRSKPSWPVWR